MKDRISSVVPVSSTKDTEQGDATYAVAKVVDDDTRKPVWMNVYYEGTTPSPSNQHEFINNVVIAKSMAHPQNLRVDLGGFF